MPRHQNRHPRLSQKHQRKRPLKQDILDGKLGAPLNLKTKILWPRKKEYFKRGSGWAGKLRAKDGTVINDSVAANACAHYLHNMLFVCGPEYLAAEPKNIKADLIRVNDIENFDNATISFELECGAKCLFIAAHSTDVQSNPMFEYKFEHATVHYDENIKDIVAHFDNGEEKHYGNPFAGGPDGGKSRIAIEGCLNPDFKPVCSPYTAAAHTRCIETVQTYPIHSVNTEYVRDNGELLYVEGLAAAMTECYEKELMLSDLEIFDKWVK